MVKMQVSLSGENSKKKQSAWNLRTLFGLKGRRAPKVLTKEQVREIQESCNVMQRIHGLFSSGIALLDEVDLILHPLKSELNWPLGEKQPLDMSNLRSAPGLRWELPLVLLDAVIFQSSRRLATDDLAETSSACALLRKLVKAIEKGLDQKREANGRGLQDIILGGPTLR